MGTLRSAPALRVLSGGDSTGTTLQAGSGGPAGRVGPHPPTSRSQRVGDRWVSRGATAVLRVPSVAVPYSYNYLLNPLHEAFDDIEIGQAEPFPVDERLIPDR
ncbi:RES family NAD+ phosphorylase [Salinibacter ruber]|uniref:RES family NAD+ phosphorylase n=1 Tax=Salinibacter ruber TaxID=146919 RepID=UPI003C6E1D1A